VGGRRPPKNKCFIEDPSINSGAIFDVAFAASRRTVVGCMKYIYLFIFVSRGNNNNNNNNNKKKKKRNGLKQRKNLARCISSLALTVKIY
jgi:hypothetical protein